MASLSLRKKEDSGIIESLFEDIKEGLIKKKLIELLQSNITHLEIFRIINLSKITSMLKEKKITIKPIPTSIETLLSYLSKEQLISLLEKKGISYEDEIRHIESIENKNLINLLKTKDLIKKKLIKLLQASIDFKEILDQLGNSKVASMLEEKKIILRPTPTPKETILSYLSNEQLMRLLEQKGISYEDELSSVKPIIAYCNLILIKCLIKLYKGRYILDFRRELLETDNYSVFYFMLCKSILSEDKSKLTEEEILNEVYIALVKIFIEKYKIFDFRLVHKSRINLNIKLKTLEETLKKAGYNVEEIDSIKHYYKDNEFLILWYVLNKTNDEIKFSFTLEDLLVKILELFLVKKIKLYIWFLRNKDFFTVLYKQTRINSLGSDDNLINHSRSLLTTKPYLRLIKNRLLDITYTRISEEEKLAIIYLIAELEIKDLIEIQNDAIANSGPTSPVIE